MGGINVTSIKHDKLLLLFGRAGRVDRQDLGLMRTGMRLAVVTWEIKNDLSALGGVSVGVRDKGVCRLCLKHASFALKTFKASVSFVDLVIGPSPFESGRKYRGELVICGLGPVGRQSWSDTTLLATLARVATVASCRKLTSRLADRSWHPSLFGCSPSRLKQEGRFQNKLKLSIKLRL